MIKRQFVRFLIWLLSLLGVKVVWEQQAERKVPVVVKQKCTIRTFRAGEKQLQAHSVCDGGLPTHQEARERLGVAKLSEVRDEVHYIG